MEIRARLDQPLERTAAALSVFGGSHSVARPPVLSVAVRV
jgi:hypothetical protein